MLLIILISLGVMVPQQNNPLIIDGKIYIRDIYLHEFKKDNFNEVTWGYGYGSQISKDSSVHLSFSGSVHHYAISSQNYFYSLGFNCNNEVKSENFYDGFYFSSKKINPYEVIVMASVLDLTEEGETNNDIKKYWFNLRKDKLEQFDISTHLAFIQDDKWIFNIIISRNEKYFNINEELKNINRIIESIEFK